MIDPQLIKSHFPIFKHQAGLVYFDNAATTQRPQMVIDKISGFYSQENANIHRGLYALSVNATLHAVTVSVSIVPIIVVWSLPLTYASTLNVPSWVNTSLTRSDAVESKFVMSIKSTDSPTLAEMT